MGADARLQELGLDLPIPPPPAANRVPAARTGHLLFLAGHVPVRPDGSRVTGKVGTDLDVEEAQGVARLVGLSILATIRHELGSLDRVRRVVKLLGMVNCGADFIQQPAVIDGCSDLMVDVFGEDVGRHARSAVGMAQLPGGIPVEIEVILEVE